MPEVHERWTVLQHEPIEAIDEGPLTVAIGHGGAAPLNAVAASPG